MSPARVRCAKCESLLKLRREPPPGSRLRCPKCGATLRAQSKRPRPDDEYPDNAFGYEDDEFYDDAEWERDPRRRPRSRLRRSNRGLIIGLSVGGGVLLLAVVVTLVLVLGFGKNTKSAASMDDGSPITIYNPRFKRSSRGNVVLLLDYKFNEGAPTARDVYRLNYNGRSGGSVKYGSRILYGRDMRKSGTLRSPYTLPTRGSYDVKYMIIGPTRRMSNYLTVTIPDHDADLPRD